MEKIRLGSGKELEIIVCGIIVCGILAAKDTVTVKFLPGDDTLDGLNALLSDPAETDKITLLSEADEELAIYTGYTDLASISLETDAVISYTQDTEQTPITGKLVTAVLRKPDQMEQQIRALEQQITDTQMALCEIYEGMEV